MTGVLCVLKWVWMMSWSVVVRAVMCVVWNRICVVPVVSCVGVPVAMVVWRFVARSLSWGVVHHVVRWVVLLWMMIFCVVCLSPVSLISMWVLG